MVQTDTFNFGTAISYLNGGFMVRRQGWNGKGMFIYKTVGNIVSKDFIPKFVSLPQSVKDFLQARGEDVEFMDSFTMFTKWGKMQPGWLASQSDVLANDWELVIN